MDVISAGGCGKVPHEGKEISNKEAVQEVGPLKITIGGGEKTNRKRTLNTFPKVKISHFTSMATTPM